MSSRFGSKPIEFQQRLQCFAALDDPVQNTHIVAKARPQKLPTAGLVLVQFTLKIFEPCRPAFASSIAHFQPVPSSLTLTNERLHSHRVV